MGISRDEVVHVAKLARLELTEHEIELFADQLSNVLQHAGRVSALDTRGVEPTAHPIRLANVLRDDDTTEPLDRETVLSQAPDRENGYFRVPHILEEP